MFDWKNKFLRQIKQSKNYYLILNINKIIKQNMHLILFDSRIKLN